MYQFPQNCFHCLLFRSSELLFNLFISFISCITYQLVLHSNLVSQKEIWMRYFTETQASESVFASNLCIRKSNQAGVTFFFSYQLSSPGMGRHTECTTERDYDIYWIHKMWKVESFRAW